MKRGATAKEAIGYADAAEMVRYNRWNGRRWRFGAPFIELAVAITQLISFWWNTMSPSICSAGFSVANFSDCLVGWFRSHRLSSLNIAYHREHA
jgi:hypothetical protein